MVSKMNVENARVTLFFQAHVSGAGLNLCVQPYLLICCFWVGGSPREAQLCRILALACCSGLALGSQGLHCKVQSNVSGLARTCRDEKAGDSNMAVANGVPAAQCQHSLTVFLP